MISQNADRRVQASQQRGKYDRLVNLGWLTSSATNVSDVQYQITEKGRAAGVVE
jgi:hypothetical protein